MSCILYKLSDDKIIEERVPAQKVAFLLQGEYRANPEDFRKKKKVAKKPTKEE